MGASLKANKTDTSGVIFYDGFCRLCSFSVQFVLKRDKKKKFSFIPIQSAQAEKIAGVPERETVDPETVILLDQGKIYTGSTAVLLILKRLPFPWFLASVFFLVPVFIREPVYRWVSGNRYRWFGKHPSCMVPSGQGLTAERQVNHLVLQS